MAQCLMWQAEILQAQHNDEAALQRLDAALRLLTTQQETTDGETQAHLFASSALVAARLGKTTLVATHLARSQSLLASLKGSLHEFDMASWQTIAGGCALHLHQVPTAIAHLHQATALLPSHDSLRHVLVLLSLMIAYAQHRERDACLQVAEQATPLLQTLNARSITQQFLAYLKDLVGAAFPADSQVTHLMAQAQHSLRDPWEASKHARLLH